MAKKEKFVMEFPIRCSAKILFEFVSTANGLGEWFADQVDQIDKDFTFKWHGSKEYAEQIEFIENKCVRFRWDTMSDDEYLEFKIEKIDVTNTTVLILTDFAEPRDLKDQQLLWEAQIAELKHRIGS
jgi:hypothetical protein